MTKRRLNDILSLSGLDLRGTSPLPRRATAAPAITGMRAVRSAAETFAMSAYAVDTYPTERNGFLLWQGLLAQD